MKTKPLTQEEIETFREYWKSLKKKDIIDRMEDLLMIVVGQAKEIEDLQERISNKNSEYLSRCRSSGGITLPPGV